MEVLIHRGTSQSSASFFGIGRLGRFWHWRGEGLLDGLLCFDGPRFQFLGLYGRFLGSLGLGPHLLLGCLLCPLLRSCGASVVGVPGEAECLLPRSDDFPDMGVGNGGLDPLPGEKGCLGLFLFFGDREIIDLRDRIMDLLVDGLFSKSLRGIFERPLPTLTSSREPEPHPGSSSGLWN
jgi:hypothetical protein